ncbi:hypothetical protein D3C81_1358920 [compost metagenome]
MLAVELLDIPVVDLGTLLHRLGDGIGHQKVPTQPHLQGEQLVLGLDQGTHGHIHPNDLPGVVHKRIDNYHPVLMIHQSVTPLVKQVFVLLVHGVSHAADALHRSAVRVQTWANMTRVGSTQPMG